MSENIFLGGEIYNSQVECVKRISKHFCKINTTLNEAKLASESWTKYMVIKGICSYVKCVRDSRKRY